MLKNDSYIRSLDLRGNRLESQEINDIEDTVKQNESLFNIDLTLNPGFTPKNARTLALKMLTNYTRAGY